jgi:hypothetical protein
VLTKSAHNHNVRPNERAQNSMAHLISLCAGIAHFLLLRSRRLVREITANTFPPCANASPRAQTSAFERTRANND